MTTQSYSITDREYAELYVLRAAVLVLLEYVENIKPGIITELKQIVTRGGRVLPAQSEFVLPVKDNLLRNRLSELLDDVG